MLERDGEKIMNMLIDRFSPPGYNVKWERKFIIISIALSCFISLGFFSNLISEINRLYYIDGGKKYLRENAICATFADVAGALFYGFTVTAITCLFFIIIRRVYLNQNSKCIYTVKRLPHKMPVLKLTLPVPVFYFIAIIFAKSALIMIYLVIYFIAVPDETLPAYCLEGIWRL